MSSPAETPPLKERLLQWIRIGVAEFIGTGMLVFFGCMGCMSMLADFPLTLDHIAWVFGIIVMCIVQTFGHISGAHVNPTVSVCAALLGHLPYIKLPLYIISQCFGAIIGFALLKAITPSSFFLQRENGGPAVCSTVPNRKCHVLQALGGEMAIAYVLSLVCCGIWDHRNKDKHDSMPIKFGLTITGMAMAGAPWSGGSMNPARSLAPALINSDWDGHWIYWVADLSGAALAALPYRFLFSVPDPSKE